MNLKIFSHILLLSAVAAILLLSACGKTELSPIQVQDFSAGDLPFDDGTGVLLKWRPVDKSHRVIQYNIYRGHDPDSLFLVSKIEVDAKTGFPGEWMTYSDIYYSALVEFETAPAGLKKEKARAAEFRGEPIPGGRQSSSSTLYKAVPRDVNVLKGMLGHYNVMGDINTPKFYHTARRVEKKGENGPETYAGYKLNQFNNILVYPKPNQTYYYCVVPVSETGQLLKPSEVKAATPRHNRPDTTAVLHSAYLADKEELRFEWSPPYGNYSIYHWEMWLMPKANLSVFHADQKANAAEPDSLFAEGLPHQNWKQNSLLVHVAEPSYGALIFYDKTSADNGLDPIPGPDRLRAYLPVLMYQDYFYAEGAPAPEMYYAAALGNEISISGSASLPPLPAYSVIDKPNDKGDNLILSFGKPLAFVTQASYANKAQNRIRLNYEFSENGVSLIENIRFSFFDPKGKLLGTAKENYPDKIVAFDLPKDLKDSSRLIVRVKTRLRGDKSFGDDELVQELSYDPKTMIYTSGPVSYGNLELNNAFYDIFSKSKLSTAYSPGMRIAALSRSYDHTIEYPGYVYPFPAILGYDEKSQRLLLDPEITVAVDQDTGAPLSVSLFQGDFHNMIEDLRKDISKREAAFKKLQSTASGDPLQQQNIAAYQDTLSSLRQDLKLITSNHLYKALEAKPGDRAWRKKLRSEFEQNSRTYAYKLLATNGKGLWSDESDFPKLFAANAGKDNWHYPKNEWFDKTKLATLIASIIMAIMVVYALYITRRKELYLRPIAGLEELDNAIGRATEMGRPVMFVPGWGTLGDPCTVSAMMILHQIAKKTAEYDTRLISPHTDYFVVPLAQEMVQTAYSEAGRPDAYNQNDIFFVSDVQFAFSAAVNGITIRDRIATVFYMGYFNAEALLMTETGNQSGAIQIAASDAITQIPFFITTCDYTLIGEEFYAAAAYLSRNLELVSMLKAQDYFKILIVIAVLIGTALSTLNIHALLNFLPFE